MGMMDFAKWASNRWHVVMGSLVRPVTLCPIVSGILFFCNFAPDWETKNDMRGLTQSQSPEYGKRREISILMAVGHHCMK